MSKEFRILLLFVCVCVTITTANVTTAYADIFNFKWTHRSGNLVVVAANGQNLNHNYIGSYDDARRKWNNSSALLIVSDTSLPNSNLDMWGVSAAQWRDNGWLPNIVAWAQAFNGTIQCMRSPDDHPDPRCSQANLGAIYVNNGQNPGDSDFKAAVLAHEIGHIVGIAHTTSSTPSIMQANPNQYFRQTVQPYDEGEFNNKYR